MVKEKNERLNQTIKQFPYLFFQATKKNFFWFERKKPTILTEWNFFIKHFKHVRKASGNTISDNVDF
jgi:hypothetical protein